MPTACSTRVGGSGGGLTVYMDDGHLVYEYNMMIIENYQARTDEESRAGKHLIVIDTTIAKPGGPAEVVIAVDGKEAARTTVARTVPAAFTATESFDIGVDLGSTVSLFYEDKRPIRLRRQDRECDGLAVGADEVESTPRPGARTLVGQGPSCRAVCDPAGCYGYVLPRGCPK